MDPPEIDSNWMSNSDKSAPNRGNLRIADAMRRCRPDDAPEPMTLESAQRLVS
jgi:hypothetical protein